jgi:hypothetical protein
MESIQSTEIDQSDNGSDGLYHGNPTGKLKQGHRCCGGCCDVRRAVIIVNIVGLATNGLMLIFFLAGASFLNQMASALDDDQAVSDAHSTLDFGAVGIVTYSIVHMAAQGIGIYGAIHYNQLMVGLCFVFYVISFIVSGVQVSIVGLVINGFFGYPHFYFLKEVRSGILSEETYPTEKQSCCCV